MVGSVEMHDDLAGQDDDGLIAWMSVQRSHLPGVHPILEQQERASRFLRGGLPQVHAPTVEPSAFPLVGVTNHATAASGFDMEHHPYEIAVS